MDEGIFSTYPVGNGGENNMTIRGQPRCRHFVDTQKVISDDGNN